MPSTLSSAEAAIGISPPPCVPRLAPYAAPATPAPSSTSPSSGERREGRGSPRRPPSTATTSWREASQAGTIAASSALSRPKPTTPARWLQVTSNGPKRVPEKRCSSGARSTVEPTPSTTPRAAATLPSTTPEASTTRRAWAGVPPAAATRARVRAWRRAPTANAGPASSTTSSSTITTTSTTEVNRAPSRVSPPHCISGESSLSGGGSAWTARESTEAPASLSSRTCCQVTGSPPTSQPPVPERSSMPKAPGSPKARG